MRRLDEYLDDYTRFGLQNDWSRTAAIAFAIHGIYTGLEDVMADLARAIDGHVPQGALSHQGLLDQMHVALDERRPALLDDELYAQLVELKAFRHFVRHQYGVDLRADKTWSKVLLAKTALKAFKTAMAALETALVKSA